jgi:hypothetical protein
MGLTAKETVFMRFARRLEMNPATMLATQNMKEDPHKDFVTA